MKPQFSIAGALRSWGQGLVVLLALMATVPPAQARDYEVERQRIEQVFPTADSVSEAEGQYQVRTLRHGDEVLGYAFQSIHVTDIPAYSGKPINMLVLLD
ncbi:regulatory protein NosR, partial [Salmonella enterica subsp. enterica]|nr:regulatory protein NosR [Salmonella enterica subsp. enterica serovar Javiana]